MRRGEAACPFKWNLIKNNNHHAYHHSHTPCNKIPFLYHISWCGRAICTVPVTSTSTSI